MNQLIADYETTKDVISRRIAELEQQCSQKMPTMEREQLDARIACLRTERFELAQCILQMKEREVLS